MWHPQSTNISEHRLNIDRVSGLQKCHNDNFRIVFSNEKKKDRLNFTQYT